MMPGWGGRASRQDGLWIPPPRLRTRRGSHVPAADPACSAASMEPQPCCCCCPTIPAGLAAVLPCFVVYLEVAKALQHQGGCLCIAPNASATAKLPHVLRPPRASLRRHPPAGRPGAPRAARVQRPSPRASLRACCHAQAPRTRCTAGFLTALAARSTLPCLWRCGWRQPALFRAHALPLAPPCSAGSPALQPRRHAGRAWERTPR